MKIITIGALKGGVGKTTFIFNLAGYIAKDNKKVLLIDLDPQANLTVSFKLKTNNANSAELFNGKVLINQTRYKNIDIISSNIKLEALNRTLIQVVASEKILYKYFKFFKNQEFLNYDYVIIDTSPSLSLINLNAFAVADSIVLVSDWSLYSLDALRYLIPIWETNARDLEISNNFKAIILNNIKHYKMSQDFIEAIKQTPFHEYLVLPPIKNKSAYVKAQLIGEPVAFNNLISKKTNYPELIKSLIIKGVM